MGVGNYLFEVLRSLYKRLGLRSSRAQPSIFAPDYLLHSKLSELLKVNIENYFSERKNLVALDVGCGEEPYWLFFRDKCSLYIGIDIIKNRTADIISDAGKIPLKSNSFDICICTHVLEHVKDAIQVISEIIRVLKPNGILFLSTHGNYPIHNYPCDYQRWTEHGLREMGKPFRDL